MHYICNVSFRKILDRFLSVQSGTGSGPRALFSHEMPRFSHLLFCNWLRGLPLITYAPRGRGGVKPPIHFYCVLHAKRGGGGPESM